MDKPILNKISYDGKNNIYKYGMSKVQGWKKTMEVYNLKENNLGQDKDINIFGIFDGHSGNEISQYLFSNFKILLLKNDNFKNGNYKQALIETFKNIDKSLRTKEVNNKLILYKKKNLMEKKEKMNEFYKTVDKKNSLNKNDKENLSIFMDIIDPNNLEEVLISDFVGSSGIVILINDKRTFVANAGNTHYIAINKKLSVINNRNYFEKITYNKNEKTRIRISQGIKYGNEKNISFEDKNFLYTRGFGDFQYKNNNLLNIEDQEISPEPDIFEIPNEEIKFLIICNSGFYDYGIQINNENNKDNKNEINIDKNITNYFVKKLQNEHKKISQIIGEYFDEFIPKNNINNQKYNTENLSCIIINFINK